MPFKRKPEFWEPNQFQDYFTPGSTPQPPPPGLDVEALQEQMIAPARREYQREVPRFEARLAKRKMGRSGAYVRSELDELYDYLTGVGGPSADIALRAEELKQKGRLSWAQLGLSERELKQKGRLSWAELGLSEKERLSKEKMFYQQLEFEKEKASTQDRQFEQQLEIQWSQQGLNEQEVADKKEMFYAEQERFSTQFEREYTLRETEAAWQHEEELSRQGLTQQEIDNEMTQFDAQLGWEKEHYSLVLTEQQRQFNDEMANTIRQTDLSFDQLKETVRQFDDTMKRLKDLDAFEMEMREDEREAEWWQMKKSAELKEIELDMMSNEIFGSWDDGFAPGDDNFFDDDHYLMNPDGSYRLDENGNPILNPQWEAYMTEHYHMGQLDLREWGLRIEAALGMVGVIPGEGGEEPPAIDITQTAWPFNWTDQDKSSFVQENPWATPEIMDEFYGDLASHGWQSWDYDTFVRRFLAWAKGAGIEGDTEPNTPGDWERQGGGYG